jgi:hypothetical protein
MNEPRVRFSEDSSREFPTNSRQQMYPRFLRERSLEEKICVIVVDDFRNKSSFETNKRLLKQVTEENATVLLIDYCFTRPTLTSFITYITEMCLQNNIPSRQFMIANYVKHLNEPNPIEAKAEEMIPKIIQNVLDLPAYAQYSQCFYQWFGYHFYTYHFIYNYKKYQHASYFLYRELEEFIKIRMRNSEEAVTVIQQPALLGFIDHIYDISLLSDFPPANGALAMSLKEYMVQNGMIVMSHSDLPSVSPTIGLSVSM